MSTSKKESKKKKPKVKAKLGPKPIEFDLERVALMGRLGCTHEEMAWHFGINKKTIQRRLDVNGEWYDPEFADTYYRGMADCKMSLRRKQIQIATEGNPTMLIWLGKNLLGQSDKTETKHTTEVNELVGKYAQAYGLEPDAILARVLEIIEEVS